MKIHTLASAAAVSALLVAGAASAQTTTPTTTAATSTTATAPALAVNLHASPTVRPGAEDILLALVTLSARQSNSTVQIPTVPLDVGLGSGAAEGHISDCRVRNLVSLITPLNSSSVGITLGTNTLTLDVPLQIAAGSVATLAVTCDIAPSAPIGGSVSLGLTPSRLSATIPGSGTSVNPSVGLTTTGAVGPTSGTVIFGNTTMTPPSGSGLIPGVPNTGSENVSWLLLISASGVIASMFIVRRLMMK